MVIVLIAVAAAAVGAWEFYAVWSALPARNSDLVLF